jgi:hypothetical protein
MHSTRHLSFALGSPALLGFVLGACFNGEQAEGLPCTANSHCGPKLECIDGYCGGNTTQVYDQCAGEDEPFEFELGPTGPGVSNPIGVLGGQFVGDDRQDLLIAQNDGSFVRIWDVPPGEQPLRPEGVAIMEQRQKSGLDFPTAYCQPASVPAAMLITEFKLIQAPRKNVVMAGNGDPARQIYIDGRSLPKDPEPSWMGSSVGHWQRETLVVDTTGFKESAWLDSFGHPRSEAMHITERYHRQHRSDHPPQGNG